MKWNELTISTTEQAVEMIAHYLHELDAGGVSIEESGTLNKQRDTSLGQWYEHALNDIPEGRAIIKSYFQQDIDTDSLLLTLKQQVGGLSEFDIEVEPISYEWNLVDDEDWANAWKQYFKPLKVSETLTIKPTWEQYDAAEGERIIELDPGMAFGTGTHPTTALCLRTLESVVKGGEQVIDVGTGSGILAIGACRLGASRVLALDLDPVAVSSAIENTALNGLSAQITVQLSDLLGVLNAESLEESAEPLGVQLPVDLVVANILAEIILLFVDDVLASLKPGGIYIASGVYKNKEQAVEEGLLAHGFEIVSKEREEDWIAFVARKPQVSV